MSGCQEKNVKKIKECENEFKNAAIEAVTIQNKKYYVDAGTGELQEVFLEKRWGKHKVENRKVERCYRMLANRVDEDSVYWSERADRLRDCGTHLWGNLFSVGKDSEIFKITHTESCRIRLCPLCAWRRSIKIQVHTRKILEAMHAERDDYEYLLVTFTVPNVKGEELSAKITDMMKAWNRLQTYKRYKQAVIGWYRGLEITHNTKKYKMGYSELEKKVVHIVDDEGNYLLNPSYDTYHPHFHCIFVVNKSYFTSRDYIEHDEWLTMWQRAMRDSSITQVDVRKIKPKKSVSDESRDFGEKIISAICEVAKYTVKSADYILPWNWELSCDAVAVLDKALMNRRLVAYGGVMKEWHKKLNLDDEIDGNLIEDGETPNGELIGEFCAVWNVGFQQYIVKRFPVSEKEQK